jgi:hypothetical protein
MGEDDIMRTLIDPQFWVPASTPDKSARITHILQYFGEDAEGRNSRYDDMPLTLLDIAILGGLHPRTYALLNAREFVFSLRSVVTELVKNAGVFGVRVEDDLKTAIDAAVAKIVPAGSGDVPTAAGQNVKSAAAEAFIAHGDVGAAALIACENLVMLGPPKAVPFFETAATFFEDRFLHENSFERDADLGHLLFQIQISTKAPYRSYYDSIRNPTVAQVSADPPLASTTFGAPKKRTPGANCSAKPTKLAHQSACPLLASPLGRGLCTNALCL